MTRKYLKHEIENVRIIILVTWFNQNLNIVQQQRVSNNFTWLHGDYK